MDAVQTLSPAQLEAFCIFRAGIQQELATNSQGFFASCYENLSERLPKSFPNQQILDIYSCSQKSSAFGHCAGEWKHHEPSISHLTKFGQENFEWNMEEKLKHEMSSQVWEGAFLQMLYSVRGFVFNFNAHWHPSNEDSSSRNLWSTVKFHNDSQPPTNMPRFLKQNEFNPPWMASHKVTLNRGFWYLWTTSLIWWMPASGWMTLNRWQYGYLKYFSHTVLLRSWILNTQMTLRWESLTWQRMINFFFILSTTISYFFLTTSLLYLACTFLFKFSVYLSIY